MRLLATVPAHTMKSSAVHFWPGDVLYGRLRPYLNKVYRPEFEGLCSAEFIVFPHTYLHPRYLQYLLNSSAFVSFASHLNTGDRPRVDYEQLGPYPVNLAPLCEQYRIADEIEKQLTRLDAAVAALERARANLKRYRASVLQAACEGRLVPIEAELARAEGRDYEPADQLLERILKERRAKWEADQLANMQAKGKAPRDDGWKAKYQEPAAPETDGLPELPEGWMWANLDAVLSRIQAGKSFRCEERAPSQDEVGVVKVSGVTWGRYNEIESKTCPDLKRYDPTLLIQQGDFLFSRANTIELVGACVIAEQVSLRVMLSDKILRFSIPAVFEWWVLLALRSPFGRDEIQRLSTGNQESMRNIGQDRIRRIRIPIPPAAEIDRIVEEWKWRDSIIDQLETAVEHSLKRSERLRQSVLKRAFEGQLVPQDPSDEPAGVLLERIRAERSSAAQAQHSRRKGPGQRGHRVRQGTDAIRP